jgi:hypothetical protein
MPTPHSAFLIKVSVESLTPVGYVSASGQIFRAATLRGECANPDLCFTEVVHVVEESLRDIERLQRHGSVVVGISERWQYDYDQIGGWQQYVFNEVTRLMSQMQLSDEHDQNASLGFDQALADRVLRALDKIYPASFQSPSNLKHQLGNEPDDRMLMTALDALLGDGSISGKALRDHTNGVNQLAMLANIQITKEGRQSLHHHAQPHPSTGIVQGDQFITYGNLGAAGRNSSGSVSINQSWTQEAAISAVDNLLRLLQKYQVRTPELERVQREFHNVRDEISEESNPDSSRIARWLSRAKQFVETAALSEEIIEAAHSVFKLFGV